MQRLLREPVRAPPADLRRAAAPLLLRRPALLQRHQLSTLRQSGPAYDGLHPAHRVGDRSRRRGEARPPRPRRRRGPVPPRERQRLQEARGGARHRPARQVRLPLRADPDQRSPVRGRAARDPRRPAWSSGRRERSGRACRRRVPASVLSVPELSPVSGPEGRALQDGRRVPVPPATGEDGHEAVRPALDLLPHLPDEAGPGAARLHPRPACDRTGVDLRSGPLPRARARSPGAGPGAEPAGHLDERLRPLLAAVRRGGRAVPPPSRP